MTNFMNDHAVTSGIDLFTAWVESRMAYRGLPSMSVAIVADQQIVWQQGFGYANCEEKLSATPETLYRIASITKLFTATALVQLRDAGKLQLDDPITKHLPAFEIQHTYPDAPPITVRNLITHTSGLPREGEFSYWTSADFPLFSEIEAKLSDQSTILPPNTKWKYSNLALALAGKIVENVSGQTYDDYIRTHILDPLQMHNTFVASPPSDHPQLATGYGRRLPDKTRAISPFTDAQGLAAAFNMTTCVTDLAKFAMCHLRDGSDSVLKKYSKREMHQVHWMAANWQRAWGLGFSLSRIRGKTYLGHGGAVLGYRTELQICPADKVAVIVLTNADDGDPSTIMNRLYRWVVPTIVRAKTKPSTKQPNPDWQRYCAKFRSAWSDSQVLVYNGELVMMTPTLANPTSTLIKLRPAGEHIFRRDEGNLGSGRHGELLTFGFDENGRVSHYYSGGHTTHRVDHW